MNSVEELGERNIINQILECLTPMPEMPIPFGDDVSAIDLGRGELAVLKTDMLVGETDVPPGMDYWQAARKAVVMTISDLAAKGVQPLGILASIGLPRGLSRDAVYQIGKGLDAGAREYDAYVLGGDTNEASDLVLSCAVFGKCQKARFMRRSGARPGDYVAVTGLFGKTASGFKILLETLAAPKEIETCLIHAVLMPHARLREGLALAQTQAVTASIDSSDGLAWSLHEISRASNVGFVLETLPIASEATQFAEMHNLTPMDLGLYGGEEYELLVTIKPALWQRAKNAVENVGGVLLRIGEATKAKTLRFETGEKLVAIKPQGWEHFKQNTQET